MGDVHFHILFDDLLEGALRHAVDVLQAGLQEHDGGKAKVPLGHIDLSQLPGEVVDLIKQIAVDEGEAGIGADFCFLDIPGIEELLGLPLAEFLLRPRKGGLVSEVELVF